MSSMARVAGRGFIITFAFTAVTQGLLLIQGLAVPRLLGPETVGLFALAIAAMSVGATLKELGTSEKLVQDRHADLPVAYSVAFTIELIISSALFVILMVAAPFVADFYDKPVLVPMMAVLGITLFTGAFLALPGALFDRKLNYLRQNMVNAVGPIVGFAVTVPMAIAGYGVWSLVYGAVAPMVVAVIITWSVALRPRLRLQRDYLRGFLSYGWPLWLSRMLGLSTTVIGTLVISRVISIEALGYFAVAQSIGERAVIVDGVISRTLFPILCRVQDDLAGQRRAFTITNRITAMWSGVIGFGVALFATDLIHLILGEKWAPAGFLFRMEGLSVVTLSIGWSWDIFYRARSQTKPTLVWSIMSEAWVFVILLPATVLWGLTGAAWAVFALGVIALPVRQVFMRRIFPDVNLLADVWRELLAVGVVALLVAALRSKTGPPSSIIELLGLGLVFGVAALGALAIVDCALITDLIGRLRTPSPVIPEDPFVEPILPVAVPSISAPIDELTVPVYETAFRLSDDLVLPGEYPLWLTPGHGNTLWVTLRDTSQLAHLDVTTGTWQKWRLPTYPHVASIDARGRAWVALTLANSVAVVDPESGRRERIRLGRTRELLVAAHDRDACLVVDSGRLCIWRIEGDERTAISLPPEMRRPDFVAATASGEWWITDTHESVVARRSAAGEFSVLPVRSPTRTAIVDEARRAVWLGHWSEPHVSRFDIDDPTVPTSIELPGVPFGAALGPDGRLWLAIPELDQVVAVEDAGVTDIVGLPPGSGPGAVSVAWVGGHMYVSSGASGRLLVYA